MRSSKLSYKENATTFQPKLPNYIQRNRQLLYEVMTGVGFVNYPLEYWHYSYGDYYWAKANGVDSAIYGIMERSLSDE